MDVVINRREVKPPPIESLTLTFSVDEIKAIDEGYFHVNWGGDSIREFLLVVKDVARLIRSRD